MNQAGSRILKYFVFIGLFTALLVGWYVLISNTWRNPVTWDNGILDDLNKFIAYKNLKLSVDSVGADKSKAIYDNKYTFEYISLIGIQKEGDTVKYLFSLLPYSYLTRVAHNKKEYVEASKRAKALLELSIPVSVKPTKFLDREIFSVATYTSEPEELLFKHKPVPVKLSFVLRQYDKTTQSVNLVTMIKHWFYTIQHKREPVGNKIISWELIKLKYPEEYVKSLSDSAIAKKLNKWSHKIWEDYKLKCFGKALDDWVSAEDNGKKLLKNFSQNCHSLYDNCDFNSCNEIKRPIDPSLLYTYLMYLAYHYDLDAYKKLKYIYKIYFKNEKISKYCGQEGYTWCSFWPATFSAYPVWKEKELLNFYFDEVAPRYTFASPIVKGNKDKSMYDLKYWYSFAFQNYGKLEFLILTQKINCANAFRFYKFPKEIKDYLDKLLIVRGMCSDSNADLITRGTLLAWPLDDKTTLMYVYESMELSPYKDIRLFRPSALISPGNKMEFTSYNQKDNILTLLIAYESAKSK